MIVAFVALCVALAGTATALPGRNKVRSDDIARGAVHSSDIGRAAVRSRHIKSRNVTRSKIAAKAINSSLVGTDALTGANILESSLGTVPKAASAEALNGVTVKKFAFRTAAVTGPALTKLVELNGLTLSTACERNPAIQLTVSASTGINGAIIHSGGEVAGTPDAVFYNEDDTFNVGDSFDVLDTAITGANSLTGTVTYARPDGGVVTATFLAEETGTDECVFAGTATG
jgi:hypothetical protein